MKVIPSQFYCLLQKHLGVKRFLLSTLCFSFLFEQISGQPNVKPECSITSTITREIGNEGFHRELIYNAEIQTSITWYTCKLILEEIIPSGLYVNTDQLAELSVFGKVAAFANSTVDVEAPEFTSVPHSVFIYSDLKHSTPTKLFSVFNLPVHLRYHKPQSGGGYRKASLNDPLVYIHCNEAPVCEEAKTRVLPCSNLRKTLCLFQKVQHVVLDSAVREFNIPVGNSDHAFFVGAITFFITISGTIFILSALRSSRNKIKND